MLLRKMAKATSLALTLSLIVASLAGCTSTKKPENTTPSSTTAETSKTETKKAPVTVDWLAYNTYGQPDPNSEYIKQQEEWYNIKFNFWYIDDQQWDQVLGVRLAAGEMPDVLKVKNTAMVEKYVKQGVLAPISDDMLKKLPAVTKAIEQMGGYEGTIDGYYEGKLYVLKMADLSASYPTVLTWRKDWLRNVGINDIPDTIAEWEDAMYKFRNNDPDKNGKKDTYGMSNTTMNAIFGAYGAIPLKEFRGKGNQNLFWTKKGDRYTFAAIQPEMKDALATLAKWYKDGLIDPEFVTGENISGHWSLSQAFENSKLGVTGMATANGWRPPLFEGGAGGTAYESFVKVNPNLKFGEDYDLGKPPVGPEGKSGTHCWGGFSTAGVSFTTKLTKDPNRLEAVLNMINQVTSNYDKYVYNKYGVEGKSFKIDPKSGQFSSLPPYDSSAAEATKAGFNTITAAFPVPDFDKKTNPLLFQYMDKYKTTGYSDIYVPSTEAATKYTEDLKKLALDAYIQIITGAKPVSYFDEFVKTFNEKGGAEIEKQVNAAIKK